MTRTDDKKRESTNIVRSPRAELTHRSSELVRRGLRDLSKRGTKAAPDVPDAAKPRVLVVEDDPSIADLFAEILNSNGYDAMAVYAGTAGIERARVFRPHVALLGCVMPEIGGVDLGIRISRILDQVKIVIITEPVPEEVLEDLTSGGHRFDAFPVPFGQQEFLEKMWLWTTEPFVTDPATGLYNLRHLGFVLDTEIYRSRRYGYEFSLLCIDLEGLQSACDRLDEETQSRLLAEIGDKINYPQIRSIDYGFRFDQKSFAVLLPQTGKPNASIIAERLYRFLRDTNWLAKVGLNVKLTPHVGVASYPVDAETKKELFQLAVEAVDLVRNSPHGGVAVANEGVLQE